MEEGYSSAGSIRCFRGVGRRPLGGTEPSGGDQRGQRLHGIVVCSLKEWSGARHPGSRRVERTEGAATRYAPPMGRGITSVLASAGAALLLLASLSGCAAPQEPSGSAAGSTPASPEPVLEQAAPTATATGGAEAQASSDPTPSVDSTCGPVELYEPWSSERPSVSSLGGSRLRIPSDRGAREHANGEVVSDDVGRPVAYIVAPDDVWTVVAERLCLHVDYINSLNQVRRNSAATLYAGDTLNLSPYTVTSVGSENGEVHDNPPPDPMPAQE